jgi:hypothetical protein
MGQGNRRGFATAERTELWDRWQRGESLKAIGRAFGKPSSSNFQVSPCGGIRPVPPCRSRLALTLSEREEISELDLVFGSRATEQRDAPLILPITALPMQSSSVDQ